jgi:hypothetical protein
VLRVIINKTITFRGGPEPFSNGYTLTGDGSGYSDANWLALADAIKNIEAAIHTNQVTFKTAYCGPAGQPVAYVRDFNSTTGTFAPSSAVLIHPEVCALAQASISRRRTLAKYYHVGALSVLSSADGFNAAATFNPQLDKLTDGTLPNGVKVCAPDGTVPPNAFRVDAYLRTHQLHRGRRRPTP